ncbi:BTB/POZ fold domain and BTB/POZ domain-containing protein [Strongyloides ratti]|uniref:BTB/POZ fold domain and BTB/POZ domain-containing protein n=1 Tax=Strongyloides ratti TaxID=34506 RepID=A0A090LA26_STRRB|nr:BTB/POZ fold domain and BTB/POZ domain-containing protein [Strongyloides ratti]CEF64360.1 BTB/POZ fold domain and BTB/POZ domain-containing protein [Strongyloides ratti]
MSSYRGKSDYDCIWVGGVESFYSNFSTSKGLRTFKLVVEDTVFYINPGYFGELSSVFQNAYEEMNKAGKDILEIHKYTPSEILELLRVVTPCPVQKPITNDNVTLLIKLASSLEIDQLIHEIEYFITKNHTTMPLLLVGDIIKTMSILELQAYDSYGVLLNYLAQLPTPEYDKISSSTSLGDGGYSDLIEIRGSQANLKLIKCSSRKESFRRNSIKFAKPIINMFKKNSFNLK